MSKRNQHFVPKVYLKRWAPPNSESVFYYKKNKLEIGELRNVSKILSKRNTYTITIQDYFMLDKFPKVREDFANQIQNILKKYNAVAFYNDYILNTDELLTTPVILGNCDKWEFKKADNPELLASKRKIIANINEIRSYYIETAFDDYIEKKWNDLLDNFISQLEKRCAQQDFNGNAIIDQNVVEEIVVALLLFMCRNPHFDCNGIFPFFKNFLFSSFSSYSKNKSDKKAIDEVINANMRGLWLSQIYKALCEDDTSFLCQFLKIIKENYYITILYSPFENGSFITTDNPAFSFMSSVMGKNYNAIYFPLTPRYLLLVCSGLNCSLNTLHIKTVTNKGLKEFNRIIISNAYDVVVSDKKYLGYII